MTSENIQKINVIDLIPKTMQNKKLPTIYENLHARPPFSPSQRKIQAAITKITVQNTAKQ